MTNPTDKNDPKSAGSSPSNKINNTNQHKGISSPSSYPRLKPYTVPPVRSTTHRMMPRRSSASEGMITNKRAPLMLDSPLFRRVRKAGSEAPPEPKTRDHRSPSLTKADKEQEPVVLEETKIEAIGTLLGEDNTPNEGEVADEVSDVVTPEVSRDDGGAVDCLVDSCFKYLEDNSAAAVEEQKPAAFRDAEKLASAASSLSLNSEDNEETPPSPPPKPPVRSRSKSSSSGGTSGIGSGGSPLSPYAGGTMPRAMRKNISRSLVPNLRKMFERGKSLEPAGTPSSSGVASTATASPCPEQPSPSSTDGSESVSSIVALSALSDREEEQEAEAVDRDGKKSSGSGNFVNKCVSKVMNIMSSNSKEPDPNKK